MVQGNPVKQSSSLLEEVTVHEICQTMAITVTKKWQREILDSTRFDYSLV